MESTGGRYHGIARDPLLIQCVRAIDPTAIRCIPSPPEHRQLWRPYLRGAAGWPIHILLQQRALVGEQQRGQLQRSRHGLCAGTRDAIRSARNRRYDSPFQLTPFYLRSSPSLTHFPSTVRQMSDLLAQVKDEQGYMVIRERNHRNTAESTNARVKWYNIFQLGIVIGEGFFQVWWLRRFFEVKDPSRPSYNKGALG